MNAFLMIIAGWIELLISKRWLVFFVTVILLLLLLLLVWLLMLWTR